MLAFEALLGVEAGLCYPHPGRSRSVLFRAFQHALPPCAELDGMTRLVDGSAGPGYEYGRLEIFERGFWSNVCNNNRFTPDAAQVACKAFGYDGGTALRFTQSFANSVSQVCTAANGLPGPLHPDQSHCSQAMLANRARQCTSNSLNIEAALPCDTASRAGKATFAAMFHVRFSLEAASFLVCRYCLKTCLWRLRLWTATATRPPSQSARTTTT